MGRLRKQASETHDGHIGGWRRRLCDRPAALGHGDLFQQLRAAASHFRVQFGDGQDRMPQGRHLPDHIHALAQLFFERHAAVAHLALLLGARDAFARDAQPAQVQVFQRFANLFGGFVFGQQLAPRLAESLIESRVGAARGVAGPGFEQHRVAALQGLFLKAFHDGARGHGFLSEQIGRTHQRADAHAFGCERRGERRHHGRRARVMDAACEDHMQFLGGDASRNGLQQHVDHALPEHEAGARPDMAAAFASFKDEAARAVLNENTQQRRRGYVQIGGNADLFQAGGLVRASAGDDGKRRMKLAYDFELLGPQLVGHEAQNAHAPGLVAHHLLGFGQQLAHLRGTQQSQCQKGQTTAIGYSGGKTGRVADTRHGALQEGIPGAVAFRQRRPAVERQKFDGRLDMLAHRVL